MSFTRHSCSLVKMVVLGLLSLLTSNKVIGIGCPSPCNCDIASTVDCSNSSLRNLPHGLDRDIAVLKANNNSISNLNTYTFSDDGVFAFPRLTHLSLQYNEISSIEPLLFIKTRHVKELNLRRNNISNIHNSVLRFLDKLENLHLSGNQYTVLEIGAFKELRSLKVLDLSENEIDLIKNGAFRGLDSLSQLILGSNKLTILNQGVFEELQNLKQLQLSFNKISAIDSDVFRGLRSLETLDLMSNKISSLEPGTFIHVKNLNKLELDSNELRSLRGSLFKELENLDSLYLSNNLLQQLGPSSFVGLCNLTSVFLGSNSIHTIDSTTFQQTPKLEFLILSSNSNLLFPAEEPFIYSDSLIYLELIECNITEVYSKSFAGLPHLRVLDIAYNRLKSFDFDIIRSISKSIGRINIEENLFVCDCPMRDLWIWSKENRVKLRGNCMTSDGKKNMNVDTFSSIYCDEPFYLSEPITLDASYYEYEDIPDITTKSNDSIKIDIDPTKKPFYNAKDPKSRKRVQIPHALTATSKSVSNDCGKAWTVILILSVTVCLLLMVIAGLLVSVIFYRRHNRTIIYALPQGD